MPRKPAIGSRRRITHVITRNLRPRRKPLPGETDKPRRVHREKIAQMWLFASYRYACPTDDGQSHEEAERLPENWNQHCLIREFSLQSSENHLILLDIADRDVLDPRLRFRTSPVVLHQAQLWFAEFDDLLSTDLLPVLACYTNVGCEIKLLF